MLTILHRFEPATPDVLLGFFEGGSNSSIELGLGCSSPLATERLNSTLIIEGP